MPPSEEAGTRRGHRRSHASQRMEWGRAEICFFSPHFWWLLWRPRVPGHTHKPLTPGRLCLLAAEVLCNRMFRLMESYCLNCGWIGAPVM